MLKNQKCILAYGLTNKEKDELEGLNIKIISITTEMASMKLRDIINGFRFETVDKFLPQEKVVIFNSFEDEELQGLIKVIKAIVEKPIMAVVTPTSIDWSFKDLINHLIEEREWYKASGKK